MPAVEDSDRIGGRGVFCASESEIIYSLIVPNFQSYKMRVQGKAKNGQKTPKQKIIDMIQKELSQHGYEKSASQISEKIKYDMRRIQKVMKIETAHYTGIGEDYNKSLPTIPAYLKELERLMRTQAVEEGVLPEGVFIGKSGFERQIASLLEYAGLSCPVASSTQPVEDAASDFELQSSSSSLTAGPDSSRKRRVNVSPPSVESTTPPPRTPKPEVSPTPATNPVVAKQLTVLDLKEKKLRTEIVLIEEQIELVRTKKALLLYQNGLETPSFP